jgi:Na+/H+ antiporter NhaD/arsenite permease-like protein
VDLAWISLGALMITLLISCTGAVNAGLLAIVFAWIIGAYVAPACGAPIGLEGVTAGFPRDLFLTLVGVTLLFSQAKVNGTLDRVAHAGVRACRGNRGVMPIMFFTLALGLSSIGAGNIASAALVAPMAMAVAGRARIPAFLMTIMVAHGAIAGALSPFAPTGIIADLLLTRIGISGYRWHAYLNNLYANTAVAMAGYLIFGGWRLFSRGSIEGKDGASSDSSDRVGPAVAVGPDEDSSITRAEPLEPRHRVTLAFIAILIIGVIGFNVHVGMGAFAAAAVLTLLRMADEREAIRAMPWSVILMVCGVSVLTNLLERTGGIDLFTVLIARLSTQRSVTGVVAFVTGLISVYSSTSGVVLPTFLPTIPKLVTHLGGGDPRAIATAMIVGGHLVDCSPLSTIGALCVACASPFEDRRALFNKVLAWGLSMSIVGAGLCYVVYRA